MLRQLFRLALGARAPQVDGEVRVPGLDGAVSIRRDRHGVPYVRASTDADAFFALGFCQAQDRAFQLELLLRIARGTAAELVGEELLDADRLARRLGFSRIAAAQLAVADARTRAQLEAFARGVNAGYQAGGAGRPQELVLLGAQPTEFEASDPLAVLAFMSFAVSSNWDAELARLRVLQEDGLEALLRSEAAPERLRRDAELLDRLAGDAELLRAGEALSAGVRAAAAVGLPLGASNHWAISGSRTRTGRPLLAADPHLGPSLPAPWYLAQIRTPDLVMSGACFVSQPVMSIGHNDRVAWAVTIGHADNTDLFVERLTPDGAKVLSGDEHVPCEVREERIAVRGRAAVVERVTVTPRGPIVSPVMGPAGTVLSLRGTWMAARPPGGYQIFRARDVDEAGASFSSYPALTENRVFADVDGAIAWQLNGDLPRRRRASGLLPAPGSLADAWWEREPRGRDELPRERDPARGWVASANQRPSALDAPGAPFLGADFLDSYRFDRVAELLEASREHDVASSLAMQLDRHSRVWDELRPLFLAAVESAPSDELAVARRLLRAWDGEVAPGSAAASLFEVAFADLACRAVRSAAPRAASAALGEPLNALLRHGMMSLRRVAWTSRVLRDPPAGLFPGGSTRAVQSALERAVQTLLERCGPDEARWAWGEVRPLRLEHPFAARAPFDRIFSLPPVAVGGDAATIPQASCDLQSPLGNPVGIANLRAVMDVGAWENSRYSLAGGQSGNPCSPHFGDLLEGWDRGESITIAWTEEAVEHAAVHRLRLAPDAGRPRSG